MFAIQCNLGGMHGKWARLRKSCSPACQRQAPPRQAPPRKLSPRKSPALRITRRSVCTCKHVAALDVNTVDTSGKSRRWHESVSPASRTCSPSVSCRTRGKAALRFTRRFVCTGSHTATSHAIALDIRGRSRCPSVHLARSVRHLIEEHIMLGSRVKPSPLNSSSHGASHRTRPRSLS